MKRKRTIQHVMTREAAAPTRADGETLHREFSIDRRSIDEQARTVELSFSSEAEVERWFGIEVLDHSERSVRLGRLRGGAPLLLNHDRGDQVGVVESVRIDGDRRGRAVVRFGRGARASEIFQDVVDGIRRLVSVGYRVHRTETEQRAGGVELVRVTDWEPFEISLVSIPADDSVGVGRGETAPAERNQNHNQTMNREEIIALLRSRGISFDENATTEALRALLPQGDSNAPAAPAAGNASQPASRDTGDGNQRRSADESHPSEQRQQPISTGREERREDPSTVASRAVEADRRRVSDIEDLAERARANGAEVNARQAIRDGVSVESFRQTVLDAIIDSRSGFQPGAPGVSRNEQRDLSRFSITRGLGLLMQGRPLDGIEREMQEEAHREARESGINLEGNFHIPGIVLSAGRRDMTATGGTGGDQGGTFIETSLGSPIDLLYARMVLTGLGAQVLTGLVGNLDLPRFATGSTVANAAENAAATESSPTTDKVSLSPHRATTYVEVSQQLMIQSSPAIENMVRNDLLAVTRLLFEQRAIAGSGSSNQPLGILGTSGIGSVVGGTNGADPDWDHIVELETQVAIDNADVGSLAYLTNPKVRGKLKRTFIDASSNAERVWMGNTSPVNGYRAEVTTQVPSTLNKGTSTGVCSAILFGNFSDLILAQWGGLSIMANPYIKDIEGIVRLTVNAYHDSVVRRPQSFAAMQDALTV